MKNSCHTRVASLQRSHSFKKKSAACRGARCANAGKAVQSPRTPCGGVYFEHAQNKRRGLTFAQRVRQHAVGYPRVLWARCGRAA